MGLVAGECPCERLPVGGLPVRLHTRKLQPQTRSAPPAKTIRRRIWPGDCTAVQRRLQC